MHTERRVQGHVCCSTLSPTKALFLRGKKGRRVREKEAYIGFVIYPYNMLYIPMPTRTKRERELYRLLIHRPTKATNQPTGELAQRLMFSLWTMGGERERCVMMHFMLTILVCIRLYLLLFFFFFFGVAVSVVVICSRRGGSLMYRGSFSILLVYSFG